jgi:GNAT superfamily N-acetyltransferase
MGSSISIRQRLEPGDIGEVTRLHGAVYAGEYDYGLPFEAYVAAGLAEFVHEFDAARDRVWLGEEAGRIVGTLFLMHRGDQAQLRYFLTVPGYRGIGLGKDLMGRYMTALDECGYKGSFLWTTNELEAVASLYTRHGFVLVDEKPTTRFGKAVVEQKYERPAA